MGKYRKKPVIVEAVMWTGKNKQEVLDFGDGNIHCYNNCMFVDTLNGQAIGSVGNYILKSTDGEYAVCTPEYFVAEYEKLE